MAKKEKKPSYDHDKHTPFFNWAKRYFWLIDEQNIGNIERTIIQEYHLQFNEIIKQLSLEEFKIVWKKLSDVKNEVEQRKKRDLRKGIKIKNVFDFLKD